jgi:hypothetical protein
MSAEPHLALVRRASAWADRHEIPVYGHVRGFWLWARALRVQAEDRLPAGHRLVAADRTERAQLER